MQFLLENGFDVTVSAAETILADFRDEMRKGLAGEGTLPMLVSPFPMRQRPPRDCEVPAFDVGGTNVRSARVVFNAGGRAEIRNMLRGRMPGSQGLVDKAAFYKTLCDVLQPNIRAGETMGYCFSYPATNDGTLLFWTKGIQAPGIVGTNVVKGLTEALDAAGIPGCRMTILNDTVAALLAACTYRPDAEETCAGHVGFILGTGTNAAYGERGALISKHPGLDPEMLYPVNCESGNFTRFPRSRFDELYEAESGNGKGVWERCFSGVHLGPLGTIILREAAGAGLLSPGVSDFVRSRTFTNPELDDFCAGRTPDLFPCGADEAATLVKLIRPIYIRAARFAAVNVAAAALQAADARGAYTGTFRINIDGSTFWKTAAVPFLHLFTEQLTALLRPRSFSSRIIHIDDAPLIGAALAVN